jgi:Uma2 family endonuclease
MILVAQVWREKEAMGTPSFVLGPEFDDFEDDPPVGPLWHQDAIGAIFEGLTYCGLKRSRPRFIGNRLPMLFSRQVGHTPAPLAPDIIVHLTLTDGPRFSLDIAVDGPPTLAIEILGAATAHTWDLNVAEPTGKPQLYAAAGIREYLTFDPLAEFIREQVRAWHLSPNGLTPWLPEERTGRWRSPSLGVSFAVQDALLRIYDQDGRLVPIYREAMRALTQREREIAALQAELHRLRGQ